MGDIMKESKNVPEIRFKGFEGEWEVSSIKDIFNYLRPDNYIVSTEDYSDEFDIPVLTANKAFILGYTNETNTYDYPCVIIDDFTLDFKYVDFPFMVKSSALKILTIKNVLKYDLIFIFNLFQTLKFEIMGHARHYIGVVQQMVVLTPSIEEQSQIGTFFQNLDKQITLEQQKHDKLVTLKKAMLEKIFPKEGASVPEIRLKGSYNKWVQDILENVTDVRDGTHASPKYQLEGHPFITSKNLKNGDINYEDVNYITDSDFNEINKRSKVDVNDILMGMIGTIGNIALIRKSPDFAIKNVALIKDIGRVYYLYLYYFLQTPFLTKQLSNGMDGGTQKFIALNKIRKLSILFPSKEIQSQIGSYFQNLDNLISLQQQKIDKLKNIKKACLDKMFV